MQRLGHNVNDINISKKVLNINDQAEFNLTTMKNQTGVGPTMKGNIGQSIKKGEEISLNQKNLFNKMAEEFDIDNVIPKNEQKKTIPKDFLPDQSMQSFDLSIKDYDMDSDYSQKGSGAH